MRIPSVLMLIQLALLLGGCQNNVLTKNELATQNRADTEVARLLFDHELDENASYNVHKNGFVVIKFDRSVSPASYTRVVTALRKNPRIKGVRAEQSGREVCVLRHGR